MDVSMTGEAIGGFTFPVGYERFHRDRLFLHGGYDSFIEEFCSMTKYFGASGFRVIGFEGPGRGAAPPSDGSKVDHRRGLHQDGAC